MLARKTGMAFGWAAISVCHNLKPSSLRIITCFDFSPPPPNSASYCLLMLHVNPGKTFGPLEWPSSSLSLSHLLELGSCQ